MNLVEQLAIENKVTIAMNARKFFMKYKLKYKAGKDKELTLNP